MQSTSLYIEVEGARNKSRGNADSSRYPALPTIREGLCRWTILHIPTTYRAPLQINTARSLSANRFDWCRLARLADESDRTYATS